MPVVLLLLAAVGASAAWAEREPRHRHHMRPTQTRSRRAHRQQKRSVYAGENKISERVLSLLPRGSIFVEMGANNGLVSNTILLEARGWTGLCIEAGPSNFKNLERNRPHCTNVNLVVGDRESTTIFREFPTGPLIGHSGLKAISDAIGASFQPFKS